MIIIVPVGSRLYYVVAFISYRVAYFMVACGWMRLDMVNSFVCLHMSTNG